MTASTLDLLLDLQEQLIQLRQEALQLQARFDKEIQECNPELRGSACNLLHYLSVRQKDIRPLQHALSRYGLSSLGVIEPYTLAHLNAVLSVVQTLTGRQCETPEPPVDYLSGPQLLRDHTQRLLGERPKQRAAHIMVTMASEAATDPALVRDLLGAGMDVMRINCAHDSLPAWQAMVQKLRAAEQQADNPALTACVQADLAGPKLRTGSIQSSGRLIKLKPKRDIYGVVLEPCRVWITADQRESVPAGLQHHLRMGPGLVEHCQPDDRLHVIDCRGQRRKLHVVQVQPGACIAELNHTTYVSDETLFTLKRGENTVASSYPAGLLDVVVPILLFKGDDLTLTRDSLPGVQERRDQNGRLTDPARIHCTLPEAFDQVLVGQRVWFDDGKIGGVVSANDGQQMQIHITQAEPRGSKLRAEKGINFPDTDLQMSALTQKDLVDLEAVVGLVDMVALSFVRQPQDLELLHEELNRLGKPDMGVVLKIENQQAFHNLPRILLTGLRHGRPLGVMIARGDLAVEVGFERLSEVQQEILWLCEAAHVPVIWATQILESMAKKGVPSRAEVSDAGMSVLAECAMLNKGPYIVDTVKLLSGILSRMDQHYHKRRATLRKLTVADL